MLGSIWLIFNNLFSLLFISKVEEDVQTMIHYLKKYLECRYNLAWLRLQFTALKSDKLIKDFNLCFESAKSEFTVAYYILADRELNL